MIRLLWHVWRHGHTVLVSRNMSRAMMDLSKGWLYRCECGLTVAR